MRVKRFAMLMIAAIGGCANIPSPVTSSNPDQSFWMLEKEMVWQIGSTKFRIQVPEGFVTDYTSTPLGIGKYGQYGRAAVIHDYLYWSQRCSREQADNLFLIGMAELKVAPLTRESIHIGVRKGGGSSWQENRNLRDAGYAKVLAPRYRELFYNHAWPQARTKAKRLGARDPAFPQNPAYCSLGNSTRLPKA